MNAPLEFDEDDAEFTFDLAALLADEAGSGDASVAVMASEQARDDDAATWRVAFHGRDRDTDDAEPIVAEIRYQAADDVDLQPAPSPGESPGQPQGVDPDEHAASAPVFDEPRPRAAGPEIDDQVVEDQVVDEPDVAETPPAEGEDAHLALAAPMSVDLAYPQVWLLPVLFLAVGGLLIRSLSLGYEVELEDASPAA